MDSLPALKETPPHMRSHDEITGRAAEKIVCKQTAFENIRSSVHDYDWLIQQLEEQPQDIPALRRLIEEDTTWNG